MTMREKFFTSLRDWAARQIAPAPAESVALESLPPIATPVIEDIPAVRPRRPLRLRVSESQLAADWESARNPEFQREARALMAERVAAMRRKKEQKNGNDHKKR